MTDTSIPQKPKVDISEVYRLIDAGLSQGAVSRQLNCTQSYISRLLKARRNNGNLPAIPTPAHSDAPERISALPVHYDASELDNLRGRVATLEAFMAAIESQQRPSAPERTDRGSRRYPRKIYGKEGSSDITAGRRARIHPEKTKRCAVCDFIR